MPSFARKACLVYLLLTALGLCSASAQEFDWSAADLPEWIEDLGYEDADYDGPTIASESSQEEPNQEEASGEELSSGEPSQARLLQQSAGFCRKSLFDGHESVFGAESWCHRMCFCTGSCLTFLAYVDYVHGGN